MPAAKSRRIWGCGAGRDGATTAGMDLRRRGSSCRRRRRRAGERSIPARRRQGFSSAASPGSCRRVWERVSPGRARKQTAKQVSFTGTRGSQAFRSGRGLNHGRSRRADEISGLYSHDFGRQFPYTTQTPELEVWQ